LFRQRLWGDWRDVADRLGAALSQWVESHRPDGPPLRVAAASRCTLDLQTASAADLRERGHALFGRRRWDEAGRAFAQAARLDSCDFEALHHLGLCCQKLGRLEEAESCYRQAAALSPGPARIYVDLGNVELDRGNRAGMITWYRKALEQDAHQLKVWVALGHALQAQGRLPEAIDCFDTALSLDPSLAAAHFSRAKALLKTGAFDEGWREYEWRFRKRDWQKGYPHRLRAPLWDGRPFGGKSLLVHCEQGLGDTIQFARYLSRVKTLGGRVLFEIQSPLRRLFADLPGVDELHEFSHTRAPAGGFDFRVPLLSLPGLFKTRLESIPAEVPYLRPDPNEVERWRRRLATEDFKIGIVWAAGACKNPLSVRSISAGAFLPLVEIPGVRLFGLQKESAAGPLAALPPGKAWVNYGERFSDFSDTAAMIAALDLVLSVDTAVAHLAGAMAKPVWTLLPADSDWRWLIDRADSPWYPTMRLFRQARKEDWSRVMDRVADEVRVLASRRNGR
jgi:tetratricopeptide (TPR) repeat protein